MVMMLMMLMMTVEEVWAGRTGWGLVVSTTSLLSDFLDLCAASVEMFLSLNALPTFYAADLARSGPGR